MQWNAGGEEKAGENTRRGECDATIISILLSKNLVILWMLPDIIRHIMLVASALHRWLHT